MWLRKARVCGEGVAGVHGGLGSHTDHHGGDDGQQCIAEVEHAMGVLGPVGIILIPHARWGVSLHVQGWLWGPGPGHGGA